MSQIIDPDYTMDEFKTFIVVENREEYCSVHVAYYERYVPEKTNAPPEQCHPAEGGYIEIEVCHEDGSEYPRDEIPNDVYSDLEETATNFMSDKIEYAKSDFDGPYDDLYEE